MVKSTGCYCIKPGFNCQCLWIWGAGLEQEWVNICQKPESLILSSAGIRSDTASFHVYRGAQRPALPPLHMEGDDVAQ